MEFNCNSDDTGQDMHSMKDRRPLNLIPVSLSLDRTMHGKQPAKLAHLYRPMFTGPSSADVTSPHIGRWKKTTTAASNAFRAPA